MIRIVFTPEQPIPHQGTAIADLIDRGIAHRIHLRHPHADRDTMESIIRDIPVRLRHQLTLHSHFGLAVEHGIGGIHINSRATLVPDSFGGIVSRSVHSLDELYQLRGQSSAYSYVTLSPVFDSISKKDYAGRFANPDTTIALRRCPVPVVALGGVTPATVTLLEHTGYRGLAMMGCIWGASPDMNHLRNVTEASESGRLQFITPPDADSETILNQCADVIAGGCRWIQYRYKGQWTSSNTNLARALAQLCHSNDAILIIDDMVNAVNDTDADGVHLGQHDMPVREARAILGPTRIIGATANTLDHIVDARNAGADYIGLGPFRFTETKKKLSPILGADGYRRIMSDCRRLGIELPVVAIGGITLPDLPDLLCTGVTGVAVSGTLSRASDIKGSTSQICRALFRTHDAVAKLPLK